MTSDTYYVCPVCGTWSGKMQLLSTNYELSEYAN